MQQSIAERLASQPKWGRLSPVKRVRDDFTAGGQVRPVWRFLCDCGSETEARAYSVVSGGTQSCGCLSRQRTGDRFRTHGAATRPEFSLTYKSWRNLLTRARNPNIAASNIYTDIGIGVADQWNPAITADAFENFRRHAGDRPSRQHAIERIDTNRSYEPGNVRWAVSANHSEIKRSSRFVVFSGQKMTVAQASRASGVKAATILDRLRLGWKHEDIFKPRARSPFGLGPKSRKGVLPR